MTRLSVHRRGQDSGKELSTTRSVLRRRRQSLRPLAESTPWPEAYVVAPIAECFAAGGKGSAFADRLSLISARSWLSRDLVRDTATTPRQDPGRVPPVISGPTAPSSFRESAGRTPRQHSRGFRAEPIERAHPCAGVGGARAACAAARLDRRVPGGTVRPARDSRADGNGRGPRSPAGGDRYRIAPALASAGPGSSLLRLPPGRRPADEQGVLDWFDAWPADRLRLRHVRDGLAQASRQPLRGDTDPAWISRRVTDGGAATPARPTRSSRPDHAGPTTPVRRGCGPPRPRRGPGRRRDDPSPRGSRPHCR